MSRQMENAQKLYLRGIRDGAVDEVLSDYMGATYTQHSTGVKDGKAGFAEFFQDFFRRNPKREIEIVRAFEDGPYVFLQVYQNLNEGGGAVGHGRHLPCRCGRPHRRALGRDRGL